MMQRLRGFRLVFVGGFDFRFSFCFFFFGFYLGELFPLMFLISHRF